MNTWTLQKNENTSAAAIRDRRRACVHPAVAEAGSARADSHPAADLRRARKTATCVLGGDILSQNFSARKWTKFENL